MTQEEVNRVCGQVLPEELRLFVVEYFDTDIARVGLTRHHSLGLPPQVLDNDQADEGKPLQIL